MTKAAAVASSKDGEATQQQLLIYLALASAEMFTAGISDEVMATWTKTLKLAESLHDVASQLICYLPLWGRKIRTACMMTRSTARRGAPKRRRRRPIQVRPLWPSGCWAITKHHLGRLAEARVHLQRSLDIDTEKARLAQVNAVWL